MKERRTEGLMLPPKEICCHSHQPTATTHNSHQPTDNLQPPRSNTLNIQPFCRSKNAFDTSPFLLDPFRSNPMKDQRNLLEDVPRNAASFALQQDSSIDVIKSEDQLTFSDWKIIAFGQAIALSLACCSVSSAQLQQMKGMAHMPLFQVSFGYFFLQLHFFYLKRPKKNATAEKGIAKKGSDEEMAKESTYLLDVSSPVSNSRLEKNEVSRLHCPWYFYALIAFLDVQANYFVIMSFRHTAVINSTILTSLSVISVMVTSKLILRRCFKRSHIVGALLCVFGASCILSLDFKLPSSTNLSSENTILSGSKLLGDAFAISAALLFGLNDTLAEYTIQNSTRDEYLAMMGFFGFIFSFCESLIFEHEQLSEFMTLLSDPLRNRNSTQDQDEIDLAAILSLWAFYIFTFYSFYASASRFLTIADATLLSLSLQTSNVWTMMFSIFVQHVALDPFFFFGAAIILLGVWLYERGPPSFVN